MNWIELLLLLCYYYYHYQKMGPKFHVRMKINSKIIRFFFFWLFCTIFGHIHHLSCSFEFFKCSLLLKNKTWFWAQQNFWSLGDFLSLMATLPIWSEFEFSFFDPAGFLESTWASKCSHETREEIWNMCNILFGSRSLIKYWNF